MQIHIVHLLLLLLPFSVLSQRAFITIPDTSSGPGYVFAKEGDENVQIFCEITGNNGSQTPTDWTIITSANNMFSPVFNINGTLIHPPELIGKLTAIGEVIPDVPTLTFQTNFTIVNFTREFDNSQIQCGPSGDRRIFNVGFSVIPSLPLTVPVQTVIKDNDITVNLSVPGAAPPFPPLLSSLWTHESQPLSNGNDITLDTFTITLSNVQRNQSGNYTLTVSNGAGSTTTSFILDVQFPISTTAAATYIILRLASFSSFPTTPPTTPHKPPTFPSVVIIFSVGVPVLTVIVTLSVFFIIVIIIRKKRSSAIESPLIEQRCNSSESHISLSSGTQLLDESVTFNITGGIHQNVNWDKYCLSINVPATALPQNKTTTIAVKAMLPNDDDFLIPDNVYLVSGIYWVQCHDMFQEKVTLCIKHAAIIDSDEEATYFKFFAAKCSEGPPYELKPLHYGHFQPHLSYSTIQLKQFSFFAIGSIDRIPIQCYNVRVFYRLRNPPDLEWDMIIAMTKNEPIIIEKLIKYYSNWIEDIELNPVVFDRNAEQITFEVGEDDDGWEISALYKPLILKESVQCFKESSFPIGPSHSQFQVLWKSQPPTGQSKRKVSLNGASSKYHDHFIARLPPKNRVCEIDDARLNVDNLDIVLKELMSIADWYQLGLALKLSSRILDEIEYKCQDIAGCRREMVKHWLRMSPNVTDPSWKTLVGALKDDLVKEIAIAKKIACKYSV